MSRYLLTGASGMLGRDIQSALSGRDVTALSRADLDITDAAAVAEAAVGHSVIINAAAYTKVDDAETHEAIATAINADGAGNIARAAAAVGATLVHFSTDYVFSGTATAPYSEDAAFAPTTAYGRSKAAGESLVMALNPGRSHIIRTAWLYGQHGPNFAATMLRMAAERETLTVVDDQIGQPTWTADLATHTVALLDTGIPTGVWHGTNSDHASWFDFAQAVFAGAGLDPARIHPVTSDQFVRPAPRPAYSVLGHDRWNAAGMSPMRDWRSALTAAFAAGTLGAS
jgi:dTDP-4-dehydrorhamnose reductase